MHLPKLLSFTMPLCLIGIATAPWTVSPRLPTLFVAAFHILTMSQLGHKELRFVSYLNPLLNLFAARAAVLLCSWRTLFYRRLGQAVVAGIFAATALITVVSLIASANNYPGGEAMRVLHDAVKTRNGESLLPYSEGPHSSFSALPLLSYRSRRRAASHDWSESFSVCASPSSSFRPPLTSRRRIKLDIRQDRRLGHKQHQPMEALHTLD